MFFALCVQPIHILGQISLPLGYLMHILTFQIYSNFAYICNSIFNLGDYLVICVIIWLLNKNYLICVIIWKSRRWGTTKGVFSCTTAARNFSPHSPHTAHHIVLGLRKWMFCALYYFSIGHRIWDLETLLWIVSEWMSWILDSGIIVPTQDPGRLSQVQCDFYHVYLPFPPLLNK